VSESLTVQSGKRVKRRDSLDAREIPHVLGKNDRNAFTDYQGGQLPIKISLARHFAGNTEVERVLDAIRCDRQHGQPAQTRNGQDFVPRQRRLSGGWFFGPVRFGYISARFCTDTNNSTSAR
jgi:hypothetical protein